MQKLSQKINTCSKFVENYRNRLLINLVIKIERLNQYDEEF